MNLADQLLQAKPSTFPAFPSPDGFFSDIESFAAQSFANFRSIEVFKGLKIYAGSPDDDPVTTDEFVKTLNGVYYIESDGNQGYNRGEKILSYLTIFISHDGAFLLKKYDSLKGKIRTDEIALFLEYSGNDVISDNVTLVLAGQSVTKYVEEVLKTNYVQGHYFISTDRQKKMLETIISSDSVADAILDVVIQIQDEIVSTVADVGVAIFEGIESLFSETLRIPDRYWNVEDKDYVLKGIGDAIDQLLGGTSKIIKEFVSKYELILPKSFQQTLLGIAKFSEYILEFFRIIRAIGEFVIALVCGIWNALMDTIGGLFGLIKLIIQGINGLNHLANSSIKYASKAEYYNSLIMEYLDSLLVEAMQINWKEVIEEATKEMMEIALLIMRIPELLIKKITEINHTEAGYYLGYIIFEVVTWLFPIIKIAELGKLSKLVKFDKVRKASKIIPDTPTTKAGNILDEFLDIIEPLLKRLKEGTDSFKKLIREILQNFKKWIKEIFGIDSSINKTNITKFKKRYGDLLEEGAKAVRSKYDSKLSKLLKELETKEYKAHAENAFKKYTKNSRAKNKLTKSTYLYKHKTLTKNRKIGTYAEEVIAKLLKGTRPKSIKTPLTRRFNDNFYQGFLREVKSGNVTMKYKKQIQKDIMVLDEKTFINGTRVAKIEWHTFGEVDELVLKFVQHELRQRGLSSKSFTIIIH